MLRLTPWIVVSLLGMAQASENLTYDNLPLGELEKPIILRTYVPDPGLDEAVFTHHGKGAESPRYNVGKGQDAGGKPFQPIDGIPAAIAVNHGPALSYVFDTKECRVLYAWQGGFLDMYPYWGDKGRGNRRSFDYVPRLVGTVFYQAKAEYPLTVKGKAVSEAEDLKFIGYDLDEKGVPTFIFKAGGFTIHQTIKPNTDSPFSFVVSYRCPSSADLNYPNGIATKRDEMILTVQVAGKELSKHNGFQRDLKIKKATPAAGEDVFTNYGCVACHSVDGSLGHGPSLQGLYGATREIEGADKPIKADEAYIRESILKPNAKTAKGFPPNYMPPYELKPIEVDALVLYIQSLVNE